MKFPMILTLTLAFAAPAMADHPEVGYKCELTKRASRKGGGRIHCTVEGARCYTGGTRPAPELNGTDCSPTLTMQVECSNGFELSDSAVEGFIGAPLGSDKNILRGVEGSSEAYLHVKGDEPVGSAFAARLFTVDGSEGETFTGTCEITSPTN